MSHPNYIAGGGILLLAAWNNLSQHLNQLVYPVTPSPLNCYHMWCVQEWGGGVEEGRGRGRIKTLQVSVSTCMLVFNYVCVWVCLWCSYTMTSV